MGYCIPFLSWFSCGSVNLYNFFIGIFFHINGLPLYLAGLVISSIIVFLLAKMLGKMGGIVMIALGIVGSLLTFGISLLLIVLGAICIFIEKAAPILVLINIFSFALCIVCYLF